MKLTAKEWECFHAYVDDLIDLLHDGADLCIYDGTNKYTEEELFTIKGKIVNKIKNLS